MGKHVLEGIAQRVDPTERASGTPTTALPRGYGAEDALLRP
jgi:hypothetical protein